MDVKDVKTFVVGAISGVLGALLAVNSGLAAPSANSLEALLEDVQFTAPVSGQTTVNTLGVQNYTTKRQSDTSTPATIGPLLQSSTSYIFDSTLLGPDYGTKRQSNIIIGFHTNTNNTNTQNGISIGNETGYLQESGCIAIGDRAGYANQHTSAVAVGNQAGYNNQGENSVAVGIGSGYYDQGNSCVAVGWNAGYKGQTAGSVAVGTGAGNFDQGGSAIAIGYQAGYNAQVSKSICLGNNANVITTDEEFSLNKIAMCITVRENIDNNDGGSYGQNSFVISTTVDPDLPYIDGDVGTGETGDEGPVNISAGDLAAVYFTEPKGIGLINVKIKRGEDSYVGFVPLIHLKKI